MYNKNNKLKKREIHTFWDSIKSPYGFGKNQGLFLTNQALSPKSRCLSAETRTLFSKNQALFRSNIKGINRLFYIALLGRIALIIDNLLIYNNIYTM